MEALSGSSAWRSCEKPLVSVVLPVRDWRTTTATAICSILSQSHGELELLLVGQKNLGPLAENLQGLHINDERIRLISRQAQGIVGALNTGLAQARGEYIARMDDDDIAYPKRLEQQLSYLRENQSIGLCAGRIRFIDEHGGRACVKSGNQHYAQWLNALVSPNAIAHACYAESPMPHPTLIAHRDIWMRLGGYRDIDGPEDHDLILRAMLAGIRMGKPAEVLLDWREHPDRLTHNDTRYRRNAFVARSAWALTQEGATLFANTRATWIIGTGKQARHWHDELTARGVDVAGFVDMSRPGPQRSKRNKPVITYQQLVAMRDKELVISALTQTSARNAVRAFFNDQHWREGVDFIMGC